MSAPRSLTRRTLLRGAAAAVAARALVALVARAAAPAYPWRTVTIVQPFGPGNLLDIYARKLAGYIGPWMGQPMIVETHAGGSGNIASGIAARAAPDGHTLLIHGIGVVLQSLIPGLNAVDPLKALAPVTCLTTQPMFVTVHPSLGVRTLGELVARAKRDPGGIAYGTSGVGGIQHCSVLLFSERAQIDLLHVPFPNSMQIYSSLLSGEVPLAFALAGSIEPHVRSGKLRVLAVTSAERNPSLPDVPTIAESGYPGYETAAWTAIFATGGTPPATIDRLHREFMRALALQDIREMFISNGALPLGNTPAEFAAEIAASIQRWGPLVRPLFQARPT